MSWRYKQKENQHGHLQTYDCSKTPITAVCNSCHTPYVNTSGEVTCSECRGVHELTDEEFRQEMQNYDPYDPYDH